MSSPWIAICIWKQTHTSSERVYTQCLCAPRPHHGTAPCHCAVSPPTFLVFMCSRATRVHRHGGPGYCLLLWCQALNITVLTLPHTCQDLVSQACLAARPSTRPWSRYAGPTSGLGTGQMPMHRKHVPDMLLGQPLVAGHAPDLGNSSEVCVCPVMRWTADAEQGSHRGGGRLEQEASLHKANPHCVR